MILAGRVTNAGLIEAIDDGTLEIQAAMIVNTATASDEGIVIQAGSELLVDAATLKLFGHGAVTLDAGSKVEGGAAGDTLINANNTITGAGTIGDGSGDLALINRTHGTIDATGTLTFATGSTVTNRELLEATGGGDSTSRTARSPIPPPQAAKAFWSIAPPSCWSILPTCN